MLRKLLGLTPGVAAFLVLSLVGGGELRAQNLGDQIIQDPDKPVTRVANRGGAWLALGVGARANALSGAATTVSEGGHSLYWNPAGIATLEGFDFAFSYAEIYQDSDINHYFAAATIPFAGGNLGLQVNTLTSGDIVRTVETTPSSENVGIGSTFSWTSSAVGLTYSRLITDRLSLGGTGKWVNEGIDGAEANWFAVDVGVKFSTGLWGTTLAAAATNISGTAKMTGALVEQRRTAASETFPETQRTIDFDLTTSDLRLPTNFAFGVQVDLTGTPEAIIAPDPRHRLAALLDIADATDTDVQTKMALEYSYNGLLWLRGGKRFFNEVGSERNFSDGLSGGFGLRVPFLGKQLALDYAYTKLIEGLERMQVFSVEWGFN
jgi:hypothetical protein